MVKFDDLLEVYNARNAAKYAAWHGQPGRFIQLCEELEAKVATFVLETGLDEEFVLHALWDASQGKLGIQQRLALGLPVSVAELP